MSNRKGIGGPKTSDGKQVTSQNAVKHACCSSKPLVAGESAEEFERFWKMWIQRYDPSTDHDLFLVRITVDAAWRMQRSERALANLEAKLYAQQPDSSLWAAEQHKQLQLFHRYKTADTNAFHKALRLIDSFKKSDKQDALTQDKIATKVVTTLTQPEEMRTLKRLAAELVAKPITLPTNRQDGGCTCPPCLTQWGIAEHAKSKIKPALPEELDADVA